VKRDAETSDASVYNEALANAATGRGDRFGKGKEGEIMDDVYLDAGNRRQVIDFYRSIDDSRARAVLDFLIDHPDRRYDGAAIVEHLGLAEHRDVARSTYLIGRLAAEAGLPRPWTEGQLGYLMSGERAAVLRQARADAVTDH
jgi:hypothetical protein